MPLKIQMSESSGFDLHVADEWLAGIIKGIDEEPDRGFGVGLKWVIQLDNEDWDVWAFCSQKLTTRSKLYKWLQGLDPDHVPEKDEIVDLEPYIGRRVQVMFEHYIPEGGTANDKREKVARIRAEKTTTRSASGGSARVAATVETPPSQSSMSAKQAAAARAKLTLDDDEAPF